MIEQILLALITLVAGIFLLFLILTRPYWGIVITMVSLPLVDVLPPIPYFPSVLVLVGVATLVGFLFSRKNEVGKRPFRFQNVHYLGFLFIGWMFITNPQAAWFGADRNWFLTFVQLWVLVWLAGELLDSPQKLRTLMWIFAIASAVSSLIAIEQGQIGETISTSLRGIGLAGNPNATGRYLVVSMLFFAYLGPSTDNRLAKLIAYVGVLIVFVGVFFTLSRTSILLLFAGLGLQYILNTRRKFSLSLLFIYLSAIVILWFAADQVVKILGSIAPSILTGSDTAGLRYKLWRAAWRMWLDYKIQGIGIGMYTSYLRYYGPELFPVHQFSKIHNTYLTALAETGLVGFTFFIWLIFSSIKNFLQMIKRENEELLALRNAWLAVFIVVALGEITANGLYDKLLWLMFGISLFFVRLPAVEERKIWARKTPRTLVLPSQQ